MKFKESLKNRLKEQMRRKNKELEDIYMAD